MSNRVADRVTVCPKCGQGMWKFLGPPEQAPDRCWPCQQKQQALFEQLAAIEHERWAGWQAYLHGMATRNPDGSLTIPADLVARWDRQIVTTYAELSESEKESDREQVRRYWHLLEEAK
ncbi:MAG: hypothetical protein ACTHMJ_12235 [Thermomicrobiales bacterium]